MFDAVTESEILSAPAIAGVSLEDLPKEVTDAYARVTAIRLRVEEQAIAQKLAESVNDVLRKLRRVAYAQEVLAVAMQDPGQRRAAAFVAATAHQVCLLAERSSGRFHASSIGEGGVSSDVAATILFLAADATTDAAEIAASIQANAPSVLESQALQAIKDLASGSLAAIEARALPAISQVLEGAASATGPRALQYLLLQGVRRLASELLSTEVGHDDAASSSPILFEKLCGLCVGKITVSTVDNGVEGFDIYSTELHLASMLLLAARTLLSSRVTAVATPPDTPDGGWKEFLRRVANRRPFLWRNHRESIAAGYLNPGVSAAISFPTGGGKSTLAEMKIAGAVLRGERVLFLAPTLSLVDQTARALEATFPSERVIRARAETWLFDVDDDAATVIWVMTPERCLAMLGVSQDMFADIGLLVFDECHLMHPREAESGHRAIDAMLCVLNLVARAPSIDLLLLSAMMSNTPEIASWVGELTGRPCLSLEPKWKPTRQVRGCVVYDDAAITRAAALLKRGLISGTQARPTDALKSTLTAKPFGLFSLKQTWRSNARADYSFLPLLDEDVGLAASGTRPDWYLTPNGLQVTEALALACGRRQMKTLAFVQTVPNAMLVARRIGQRVEPRRVVLKPDERALYSEALDEVGRADALEVAIDESGELHSPCLSHHALLLSSERRLHESLFRRADGISVLVATSTLAQGMNLPSEVVLINGDSRFDTVAEEMRSLEAHELLNAAWSVPHFVKHFGLSPSPLFLD